MNGSTLGINVVAGALPSVFVPKVPLGFCHRLEVMAQGPPQPQIHYMHKD